MADTTTSSSSGAEAAAAGTEKKEVTREQLLLFIKKLKVRTARRSNESRSPAGSTGVSNQ